MSRPAPGPSRHGWTNLAATAIATAGPRGSRMRELESSLQQCGEFLLKARLVKEVAAPYCVRWVRQFLARPATPGSLADRVRSFCEDLERGGCRELDRSPDHHTTKSSDSARPSTSSPSATPPWRPSPAGRARSPLPQPCARPHAPRRSGPPPVPHGSAASSSRRSRCRTRARRSGA